jgi:hypothetical protein
MNKNHLRGNKERHCSCCLCKKSITPAREPCCSLFIERGVPGFRQRPTFVQELWVHGVCLVDVIPVAEYSFPEFEPYPARR